MTTDTLVHEYTPRGACLDLFHNRGPEVLISGPAGTGKSRACLEKLHAVALANPGMRGLIVRKSATSLTSSALVTWKSHVVVEALESGAVTFYGGSAEEPAQYRYVNGSKVMLGGMDKSSKIMSTEYDLIFVQEATELGVSDWEALNTRLRNGVVSFQQMMADCNPSFETHWLKVRCDVGVTVMLHSRHTDNPRLYDKAGVLTDDGTEYMGRLDALTGVLRSRLRDGLWSSAAGVIYDGFDPSLHVVPWFEIPFGWSRWWSVDWGFTNPMVVQCWAEDGDGRLFLYRELYQTQQTVDRVARKVLGLVTGPLSDEVGRPVLDSDGEPKVGWLEPRPRGVLCDHDPEAQRVFRNVTGLPCQDADKSVRAGIQAVTRRLRPAGDDKPRLFILEGARVEADRWLVDNQKPTSTLEELPGYVWDESRPEHPVKSNDHGCDALRYVVQHLEGRNPVRFRWLG